MSVTQNGNLHLRSGKRLARLPGLTVTALAISAIFADSAAFAQTSTTPASSQTDTATAAAPAPASAPPVAKKSAAASARPTGSSASSSSGFLGDVQDVVVTTGSRGGGSKAEKSISPVDVVTSDDLTRTGKQNLRDALNELYPSYTNVAGYQGQQGEGVKVAALRGLDPNDTLVLVNGKRRHQTALYLNGQSPTDLDLIPVSAVDHIEVLKDGAAAQYGSDAIAGVINIILKKDAEGGSASINYGQYGSTVGPFNGMYGKTGTASLNQGFKLGNNGGFINLSTTLELQRPTNDYGPYPLSSPIYPKVNGQPNPLETSTSRYRQIEGQPDVQNYAFSYNAELPITPDVKVYSFSTYAHRWSQGWGFYRTAISPQTNPALYPNGYMPEFASSEDDFQSVIGVKGTNLLGWDWDLSTSYGSDNARIYTLDSENMSLGPGFTQTNFYDGREVATEWTTNLDLTRKFDTHLFTLPLTVSAGIEQRRDSFSYSPGEYSSYADGTFIWPAGTLNAGVAPNPGASGMKGFDPQDTGGWFRTNEAVYLELNQPITKKWTVDVAGRYEYYSDFGGVWTGKLSSRYEFTDAFALRGTYSNGFSAPTLQEEHYTQSTGGYVTNPLTGLLYQDYTKLASPTSAVAEAVGGSALKPEHSTNLSFGFVLKPAPRTTLTVDAYSINIRDRILETPVLEGPAVTNLLTAAGINNVTSVQYFTNGANTTTRGVDLTLEHHDDFGKFGQVRWTLDSNQNVTTVNSLNGIPGNLAGSGIQWNRAVISQLTQYYPKNVTSLTGDWRLHDFELSVKETRYSSTNFESSSGPQLDQHVAPAFITDLNIGYWFTKYTKISVGANNLFDRRPSEVTGTANKLASVPVTSPNYSWYSPYGIDGGFYYIRLDTVW
jgi:iron complex outermembrane receptor protein